MRRVLVSIPIVALLSAGACGNQNDSTFPNGGNGADGGDDGSIGLLGDDGGPGACQGLACQQHACANGGTTSVSGTVFDPAGKVPLYNAIVYVPNAPLDPLAHGASCDKCGAISGSPIATTITDAAGHFKLDNVPVVDNLPLVVQIGKWRRQVTLTTPLNDCADTPVPAALTRLPRNHTEGDIPQIALTTGLCDPLECLLRKIGIDDAEFTNPDGPGRVHVFQGQSSPNANGDTLKGGYVAPSSPAATTLWSTTTSLSKYDVVLLACECNTSPEEKPDSALEAMHDYANAGGRVFASHYHYYWLHNGDAKLADFDGTAQWLGGDQQAKTTTGTIDDSFPKGQAFRDWMVNVGGSTSPGSFPIGQARYDVSAVNPPTQRWVYDTSKSNAVEYMTFNTPIGTPPDQQCGRIVYSDLHVSGGTPPNNETPDQAGQPFPTGCHAADLSEQEKALEFMLFDLTSCVLADTKPPTPPPPK